MAFAAANSFRDFQWGRSASESPRDAIAQSFLGAFFFLGFSLAVVLGTLDFSFAPAPDLAFVDFSNRALAAWLLIAALLDREPILLAKIRLPRLMYFAVWAIAALLLPLGMAYWNRMSYGRPFEVFYHHPGIWLWLVALWLAMPLIVSRQYGATTRCCIGALMLYGTWCTATALTASNTKWSIEWATNERVIPIGIGICWLRARRFVPEAARTTSHFAVGFWILFALGAVAVAVADRFASPELQAWFAARKMVYVEHPDVAAALGYPARRLTFPMLEFNRLGYQSMIILFLLAAASLRATRAGSRARFFCYAGAAAILVPLVLCGTRGTLLAAMCGVVAAGFLCSRRGALLLAAGSVVFAFGIGVTKQRHLRMAFDPKTYTGSGPMTSMQARIVAWNFGIHYIANNPLTGSGFGYKLLKTDYQTFVRAQGSQQERDALNARVDLHHMHNLWLETAAECGLPALAMLLIFLGLRWSMLARAWRGGSAGERAAAAIWCGGELAIVLASFLYYMLKQNSGGLTWIYWFHVMSNYAPGAAPPALSDAKILQTDLPQGFPSSETHEIA